MVDYVFYYTIITVLYINGTTFTIFAILRSISGWILFCTKFIPFLLLSHSLLYFITTNLINCYHISSLFTLESESWYPAAHGRL
jgi:hypothetical protein